MSFHDVCVCLYVCLCHRQEVCESKIIMCPLCDKRCKVWRLSDTCMYAKVFPHECIKHILHVQQIPMQGYCITFVCRSFSYLPKLVFECTVQSCNHQETQWRAYISYFVFSFCTGEHIVWQWRNSCICYVHGCLG